MFKKYWIIEGMNEMKGGRKEERKEGRRETRREGKKDGRKISWWLWPITHPKSCNVKLKKGNFIQSGTRKPEEGALTHYHSSQRPQQEETYPAFPAESVYFTTPAGGRKISPYPATNPANGNHCKSANRKPSPPWISASSDGLLFKARIPTFSFCL